MKAINRLKPSSRCGMGKNFNQNLMRLEAKKGWTIKRRSLIRIFSGRYRNRRKRFGLRLNLIAGLLNYELAHAS